MLKQNRLDRPTRPLLLLLMALLLCATLATPRASAQSTPPGAIDLLDSSPDFLGAVQVVGTIAYAGEGAGLTLIDVSNGARPAWLGRLALPSRVTTVSVNAPLVYLGMSSGLAVVDASDPRQPRLLSSYGVAQAEHQVEFQGSYAYILYRYEQLAGFASRLAVLSLADPARPQLVAEIATTDQLLDLALAPGAALLLVAQAQQRLLYSYDLAQPAAPVRTKSLLLGSSGLDRLFVSGGRAFVASVNELVQVDISTPTSPAYVGSRALVADEHGPVSALLFDGDRLYLGKDGTPDLGGLIYAYDLSNPSAPTMGTYGTPGGVTALALSGGQLYAATGGEGLRVFSRHPQLELQGLYRSFGQTGAGTRVIIDGARAVITVSNYPFRWAEVALVDLSQPASPQLRSRFFIDAEGMSDLALRGSQLLLLTIAGLEVWDVSDLANPSRLGDYRAGGETPYFQQLLLVDRYAYLRSFDRLEILDLRDLSNPTSVANYATGDHLLALYTRGTRGYLISKPEGLFQHELQVLNLDNPRAPRLIKRMPLGSQPSDTVEALLQPQGDYLLATLRYHQLDAFGRLKQDTGELLLIDISRSDSPRLRGAHATPKPINKLWSSAQRLYLEIGEPYRLLADELRVLDLGQPDSLRWIGSYQPGGRVSGLLPYNGGATLLVSRESRQVAGQTYSALEQLDAGAEVRLSASYALGSAEHNALATRDGYLYTTGTSLLQTFKLTPERLSPGALQCFPETRICMADPLLAYWRGNGALPVFGLPLQPAREELNADLGRPRLAQWLERNRLELHPENQAPYHILLGRLGAELLKRRGVDWQALPRAAGPQPGCLWFAETQHNVCDQAPGAGFKSYWETHGLEFDGQPGTSYAESLALFGLPLSEPAMETNSSGDTVLTQWFERARFEWHPGNADPYRVLLGRLGAEML